jgi:hypothetical protein
VRLRLAEVVAELPLEDAVDAADLLLLSELQAEVTDLAAAARRAGREASGDARTSTSWCSSASLEEELGALPPAEAADGFGCNEPLVLGP